MCARPQISRTALRDGTIEGKVKAVREDPRGPIFLFKVWGLGFWGFGFMGFGFRGLSVWGFGFMGLGFRGLSVWGVSVQGFGV